MSEYIYLMTSIHIPHSSKHHKAFPQFLYIPKTSQDQSFFPSPISVSACWHGLPVLSKQHQTCGQRVCPIQNSNPVQVSEILLLSRNISITDDDAWHQTAAAFILKSPLIFLFNGRWSSSAAAAAADSVVDWIIEPSLLFTAARF